MATEVAFSDLNTWLGNQPANTADTPYEITVTGLTVSDIGNSTTSGTLGYIINSNNTKFIDLSTTEIPSGVTDMEKAFFNGISIVAPPIIPEGVTTLKQAFGNCRELVTSPNIPSTATAIQSLF